MKTQTRKTFLAPLIIALILFSCNSSSPKNIKTEENMKLYFFKCSVSDDLYGASLNKNGDPLPTPGGGEWLPIEILNSTHLEGIVGFDKKAAYSEIVKWGCHWFTTKGPRDIYWGEKELPNKIEDISK